MGELDPERVYADLWAKMKSLRLSWNYKIKNLEKKLADFNQLVIDYEEEDEMKEAAGGLKEFEKNLKQAWEGMEKLNTRLIDQIVIVNKTNPIKDGLDAGIEKLFKTHSEYQEKWEAVKQSSDRGKIWRKLMLLAGKDEPKWDQKITKQEENNFQTFKPSVDLKPNYLDVESSFIEIMSFMDGAEQYLKTGYRGQVPNGFKH